MIYNLRHKSLELYISIRFLSMSLLQNGVNILYLKPIEFDIVFIIKSPKSTKSVHTGLELCLGSKCGAL